jgi:leader peptidase (prepilin peptidase)/N-methyltransferase
MSGSAAWTAGVTALSTLAGAASGLPASRAAVRRVAEGGSDAESAPVLLPAWSWTLIGAIAGAAMGLRSAHDAAFPAYLVLAVFAAPLCAVDLAVLMIPDRILGPAALITALCLVTAGAAEGDWAAVYRAGLAALAVGAVFFVIALFANGGLGFADVTLLAYLALLLGYQSWSTVAVGVLLGLIFAAVAGLVVRAARRIRILPLAPWLLAGAIVALVV